jgi:hypothetical protein
MRASTISPLAVARAVPAVVPAPRTTTRSAAPAAPAAPTPRPTVATSSRAPYTPSLNSCSSLYIVDSPLAPDVQLLCRGAALVVAASLAARAAPPLPAFDEARFAGAPAHAADADSLAKFLARVQRITRCAPEVLVLAVVHFLRAAARAPAPPRAARLLLLASCALAQKTHEDRAVATRDWAVVFEFAVSGVWAPAPPAPQPPRGPPPHAAACAAPSTYCAARVASPRLAPRRFAPADVAAAEAALLGALSFRVGVARDTYLRVFFSVREAAREHAAATAAAPTSTARPLTATEGRLLADAYEAPARAALQAASALGAAAPRKRSQSADDVAEQPRTRAVSRAVLS